MKKIKLSQQGKNKGKYVALVDDEDFDYLNQFNWSAAKNKKTYYAVRNSSRKDGKQGKILMHREIMNTPDNLDVDHRNNQGFDNQKNNMRNCTRSQNLYNKTSAGKSKYLGVNFVILKYKNTSYKYIASEIRINKKRIHLGYFKTEELAAIAYNEAAIKHHGEFANLNIIT